MPPKRRPAKRNQDTVKNRQSDPVNVPKKDRKDTTEASKKMKRNVIFQFENVVRAIVASRPSKIVKSPYMADIIVTGETDTSLCHSPSLGCAGIITAGTNVIVTRKKQTKSETKSKYSLDLVDVGSSIIGVNPLSCNKMVRKALEDGAVKGLPKFDPSEIKAEASVEESRFDFKCVRDNVDYYIEVKGVPCACIEDIMLKEKKNRHSIEEINAAEHKIAYFPDGYRKPGEEVISPRALKHVQHLQRLAEAGAGATVCALVFVVQRSDCASFQPSHRDPRYREAVFRASEAGVKVLAHQVIWSEDGAAVWADTLPINLHDKDDQF